MQHNLPCLFPRRFGKCSLRRRSVHGCFHRRFHGCSSELLPRKLQLFSWINALPLNFHGNVHRNSFHGSFCESFHRPWKIWWKVPSICSWKITAEHSRKRSPLSWKIPRFHEVPTRKQVVRARVPGVWKLCDKNLMYEGSPNALVMTQVCPPTKRGRSQQPPLLTEKNVPGYHFE